MSRNIQVRRLTARIKQQPERAVAMNPAVHIIPNKTPVRTALHIPVPAHVRPAVQLQATAKKTTFTRMSLPDGDFMMNYYYRRDKNGDLVPEDVDSATHFERVVYDRDGNIIGSTNGEINDVVRW